MKVLVTGGAGFIGSNLVVELRRRHPTARIVGQALTVKNVKVDKSVAEAVAGKVSGLLTGAAAATATSPPALAGCGTGTTFLA